MEKPVGFLLIDKAAGPTSHDVVDKVRRLTSERTVGHAGTLDPFATGLLIIGVGRPATKEFQKLVGLDKEYEATFVFGATSNTDDKMGRISLSSSEERVLGEEFEKNIRSLLPRFTGTIKQTPPAYAAIKIGGKKMYEAAREGKPLVAEPREVRVDSFELLEFVSTPTTDYRLPTAKFRITCGSGTYIRALARDLGEALGTGAYVEELRRTKVGPFSVSEAATLEALSTKLTLLPVEETLARLSV